MKNTQIDCKVCRLDSLCFPRGLCEQEVEKLSLVVKNNMIIQKGEYIYRQGSLFESLIAIKSGSAKLVINNSQGNTHLLNLLLPGELIGFDGLYQNKYNCSVIALEITHYCKLPADKFATLYTKIPSIARELFKHSSETINSLQNQVVQNRHSAEEKLAMFLINLSNRLKRRGFSSLEFNIRLTRQEIAEHLGLTFETVSRMLKKFQNDQLINVDKKYIIIKNLQKLQRIAIMA
jgi:CRP/FNR family transcriptional regulator